MLEFYTDKIHKAKKVHKCDLCGHEIVVGEKYHRQSGKYEGDFFDRCIHEHCNNIITEFCRKNNENEYSPDWIVDWLSDLYCYDCKLKEECTVEVLQCKLIIKNFIEKHKVGTCPDCGGSVCQNADESKYCSECGQKLDWEVKE